MPKDSICKTLCIYCTFVKIAVFIWSLKKVQFLSMFWNLKFAVMMQYSVSDCLCSLIFRQVFLKWYTLRIPFYYITTVNFQFWVSFYELYSFLAIPFRIATDRFFVHINDFLGSLAALTMTMSEPKNGHNHYFLSKLKRWAFIAESRCKT